MADPIPMPPRGSPKAPKFDTNRPAEFRRYFDDAEYLLEQAKITDVAEKKKAITRYLPVPDQELLECLEEFKNGTYEEFKNKALALYVGNDADHLHTLHEWDAFLGSTARTGIQSEEALATFYRGFLRISTYLISKQRLSETERSHAFLRALQPASLQAAVRQRLQILKPSQHADDPYAVQDIYDSAKFAFTHSGSYSFMLPTAAPIIAATTPEPVVKRDPELAAILATLTKLVTVMAAPSTSDSRRQQTGNSSSACSYCNEHGHFFRDCTRIGEDIRAGICKRNGNNKLVLPNDRFVPNSIDGDCLRQRFLNWHEQNPGQRATTQLVVELANKSAVAPGFMLTDEARAESLVAELNMVRTRMAARKAIEAGKTNAVADETVPKEIIIASPNTPNATQPPKPAPVPTTHPKPPTVAFPEHPFAAARDAAYAPPKDRNVGAAPKQTNRAPPPPVWKETDARDVLDAAMNAPITLSQRQLFSLSPDARSLMRESLTPNRLKETATHLYGSTDDPFSVLVALADESADDRRQAAVLASLPASVSAAVAQSQVRDSQSTSGSIETFMVGGPIGGELVVSADAKPIRCILPVVDNQQHIESIVDPGSQVCAMSERVCHSLAIPYDPTVILHMQSANGQVAPSLGLARNVPFRIGDITLYLQIHVVRDPAYDILLGRPFDVLTQSVVRNYANADQTLTISDPNTGKMATVPTIARGSSRAMMEDFLLANHSPSAQ
ncbi:Integrase catalytic domain-containing protein [Mycena kentingensis (nom. inval.)]|nr:Integrase catalytic domain-containing protein [Mycena kentingensis (nom. inval.)]